MKRTFIHLRGSVFHEFFSTIVNVEMIHIFIELTFVGLLIEDSWIGEHVIEPGIFKIRSCLPGPESLKIRITIDQPIHVGDGAVMNEVADVAAAGNSYNTARLSMFFEQKAHVQKWSICLPVIIRHGILYVPPICRAHANANISGQ